MMSGERTSSERTVRVFLSHEVWKNCVYTSPISHPTRCDSIRAMGGNSRFFGVGKPRSISLFVIFAGYFERMNTFSVSNTCLRLRILSIRTEDISVLDEVVRPIWIDLFQSFVYFRVDEKSRWWEIRLILYFSRIFLKSLYPRSLSCSFGSDSFGFSSTPFVAIQVFSIESFGRRIVRFG